MQNSYGGGVADDFLVRFAPDGTRIWATYYGGVGDEDCFWMTSDTADYVYLVGKTGSVSGISHAGFQNYLGGGSDAFVAKFDSTGYRLCATYYGGLGTDWGLNAAIDPTGNLYLTGRTYSYQAIAFNGFKNTNSGNGDAFLVKFGSCMNVGLEETGSDHSISIFPNPSTGIFTIESKNNNATIEFFNSLGELVLQKILDKQTESIDLSGKAKGIYFVRVLEKGEVVGVGKVVVID